jgi:hypothetical protein
MKSKRHPKQKITVDFSRTQRRHVPFATPERTYGGCGVLTVPPQPYRGPQVMEFDALVGRERVHFRAVRLEYSPTGHAGGSFRIDELTVNRRGDQKMITLGYNYSCPDADVCARLARQHRQS